MKRQESLLFNLTLPVKIRAAIPKPWQVQHEINTEIGVNFFAKFVPTLCVTYQNKEELLAFQRCITIIIAVKYNDFMTYLKRLNSKFTL